MPGFDAVTELAEKYSEKLRKKGGVASIVQIGSSLRKEDFGPDSDLDLLVVYGHPVRRTMSYDRAQGIEIQLIRRDRKQFVRMLEEGNPVDLIALRFGKVLYDDGFLAETKKKGFGPTESTIKGWVRTASFNLMDAAHNYTFPCACDYFKALHHAAREFCRAMLLKERGVLLEGDKAVLDALETDYPDLYRSFLLIVDGKKQGSPDADEWREIKHPTIESSGLGKYLLAAEEIEIRALKSVMGLNAPKVNDLISQLRKKYRIGHYSGFYLIPEQKELLLNLSLKGNRFGMFRYSLEDGKLVEAHISKRGE